MEKKQNRLILRTIILVLLFSAVGYALYSNLTQADRETIGVGDKAPNFALEDMEGNVHKLSDYEGQGVFLNFWGTWCEPCKVEMPYMENQYSYYKDDGVTILAVNVGESTMAVEKFVEEYGMTFPVLRDTKSSEVQRAYNIAPLPTTILINPEGVIEEIITTTMTEEKVRESMEKIKP
ncbi:peroxiredoxin [Bacillus oleivorans]|uniref:Peroxiredoxin n=1 Tax=Bacillus oleivorans TaxID=1448271 RepID=A0A285CM18_9BACI|nr:thiol-disulfide oxidoreductase ResA [Bacillus oleivorans]SNX68098.1 peroxiredoxin [Bacillus oleivorans]